MRLRPARRTESGTARRSEPGLTRRASLNAIAAGLDFGSRLVVGLVVNPLLVSGLGDLLYGVWQILGRLLGYISPASGRPMQALKWTIAQDQHSTDYDAKRAQVGSAVAVALLFSPLMLLLGAVVVWFVPIWLRLPVELWWTVRVATALLLLRQITATITDVPRSVLEGENLGYKRMGLSAGLVVTGGLLVILALHLETGLIGVAAAKATTGLLSAALFFQVARQWVRWFGIARPARGAVRRFLGLSGWFLAWSLIMRLLRASDVVVLGLADSPEAVTAYALTKYVPETLIGLVAIVVLGVAPGLGGIIGSGDRQKGAAVRAEIMAFTWLVITVAGAATLLWNRSFVGLWVEPKHYAGAISNLLIVLLISQFVMLRTDANIIDLTLQLRSKVLLGFTAAILSLGLSVAFILLFDGGIVGLCAGFLIGRSLLSVTYPRFIGRHLGLPFSAQVRAILRPAAVTVVLYSAATGLGEQASVHSWFALVLAVGATLVLVTPVVFVAGLTATQRDRVVRRGRRLVGRRRASGR